MFSLLYHILEMVFPTRCAGCQKISGDGALVCQGCRSKILINQTLFCSVCRARLPDNKKICHKDGRYLLGAATSYDGTIKNLIWDFKYNNRRKAADFLAELVLEYLNRVGKTEKDFILVPIPLHRKKERKRGYNQSKIIAEKLGAVLELAVSDALIKLKDTPPQMTIGGMAERKQNIAGSFAVNQPEKISGRNIILVDDVTTSGSTLNEAAMILKSAGAKKIIALTIARAG